MEHSEGKYLHALAVYEFYGENEMYCYEWGHMSMSRASCRSFAQCTANAKQLDTLSPSFVTSSRPMRADQSGKSRGACVGPTTATNA